MIPDIPIMQQISHGGDLAFAHDRMQSHVTKTGSEALLEETGILAPIGAGVLYEL